MEIGEKVSIKNKLVKIEVKTTDGFIRKWDIIAADNLKGVFVGVRVIKDIEFEEVWNNESHPDIEYKTIKSQKVALFAINKKQTIYAPLDCL